MANTLSIVLLVIIVVVFAVLGTFMFASTRNILVKQQESMLQTKTQAIVSEFDALFKEKGALVKQMSTNTLFQQYIETTASAADAASSTYAAETQATLASIVKAEPSFADAWVAGLDGKGFWIQNDGVVSAPDFDIQSRPYYKPVTDADGLYFSDPYIDIAAGDVLMGIFYPIKDDNNTTIGFACSGYCIQGYSGDYGELFPWKHGLFHVAVQERGNSVPSGSREGIEREHPGQYRRHGGHRQENACR
ncbi:PDC sensor domain-containing protein [Paenibacillus amylolyticus]|nr:PDC sensor domain-containing protein [Paenibacillus amylolyticus]